MTTLFFKKSFQLCMRQLATGIVLCWLFGFLSGVTLAYRCRTEYASLMCSAAPQPVSIVGLIVCALLPLALLAFAIYNRKRWMIYSICFYKSFSHFFCASAIFMQFRSAGWLVYLLMMFADTCVLVDIFLLSLLFVKNQLRCIERYMYCGAMFMLAVCGIVYCWISPLVLDIF